MSNLIRTRLVLSAPGFTKTAGADELTTTIAKMVPSELHARVNGLRSAVNNANAMLKRCCGSNFDNPQGGLVSIEESSRIIGLSAMLDLSAKFRDESIAIIDELNAFINSGEFANRLSGVFSPEKLERMRVPTVVYSTIIAKKPEDVIDLTGHPEVRCVRLVPRDDERFIEVAQGIMKMMLDHYEDVKAQKEKRIAKGKTFTEKDLLRTDITFLENLAKEKEVILAQLGHTDQYDQISNLIDNLRNTQVAMSNIMEDLVLSDGSKVSEAVDNASVFGGDLKIDFDNLEL